MYLILNHYFSLESFSSSEVLFRLFGIVVDTGIQIWNANEVNGIEFPVLTPLLPFLPLEPNITTTESSTTAAIETVCTNLCEGLADGTFISDECCSPIYCICPYPIVQSCNENDFKYKEDTSTFNHTTFELTINIPTFRSETSTVKPSNPETTYPTSPPTSSKTSTTKSSSSGKYQFCPKQQMCIDSHNCFESCCSPSKSAFFYKESSTKGSSQSEKKCEIPHLDWWVWTNLCHFHTFFSFIC